MNTEEFNKAWGELSEDGKRAIKTFQRYPTERNNCYTCGYLAALWDAGCISDHESYTFLLALCDHIEAGEKFDLC